MKGMFAKLNLDQLEETFEDDDEFDSAVQIKHDSSLELSPSQTSKGNKSSNVVRCSFGVNSQQKINPLRLQFNNITSSKKKVQDTAQFPKYKKFLKRVENGCQQIEELSVEQEQSVHQSKEQKLSKRFDLRIQTNTTEEEQGKEQMEYFVQELIKELEKSNKEKQELKEQLDRQRCVNERVKKLNQDITSTLDETQEQLMKLMDENKLLKRKLEGYSTLKGSQWEDQRISTFLSSDHNESDATTYSSKDVKHKWHDKENLEPNYSSKEILSQITRTISCPANKIVKHIKKLSQTHNVYQNMVLMLILLVSKCFYKEDDLDQEGKQICIELVQHINTKQLDQLVPKTEHLMNFFEQRFMQLILS